MSKKKQEDLKKQGEQIKKVEDKPIPDEQNMSAKCEDEEKKINEVTPKIESEYKVVILERNLSQHQASDKLYADVVRVELSFSETDKSIPFEKGAKFACSPANVDIFLDAERTKPFNGDLAHDQLNGGKWTLYLYGKTEGEFKAKLTLNDPQNAKIKLKDNPAESTMAVVKLQMELYSDKKAHSKVSFDATAPARTAMSDADRIGKGRLLQVQDGVKNCRAKLVVKKPDGKFWSVGEGHYVVTLGKKTGSGDLKVFKTESGGAAEALPMKLAKAQLGGDVELWVEGAAAVDKFRDALLYLGMDRNPGGLAKTEKKNGDFATFTVVEFEKVTPDAADYKQWVNLPADANKPEQGQKIKAKAKLTKALQNVKIMFSLVPDANNPTDLAATVKHTAPKDTDAAVDTDNQGVAESGELKLSRYGGDKFKVLAYALEAPPVGENKPAKNLSKDIAIWRKLFYKVDCMNRYGGASTYSNRLDEAGMKNKIKSMFVEMERSGNIGAKAFQSVVKDSQIAAFNTATFGADVTRTINIGLVEAQTGDAVTEVSRTWTASAKDYDGAAKTTTETLDGFTMEMETKDAWLKYAKYRNKDVNPAAWTNLDKGKVSLSLDGLKHKVKVDLSGVVTNALPANKIEVEVGLKKLNEWSGDSTGNTILIGMRWREIGYPGQEKQSALQTTLHEAGHFLGLAPKTKPDAAKTNNPLRYDQTGPHCKFNTNGCVMYHAFQMVFDFCATCQSSIRARDISNPKVSADAAY